MSLPEILLFVIAYLCVMIFFFLIFVIVDRLCGGDGDDLELPALFCILWPAFLVFLIVALLFFCTHRCGDGIYKLLIRMRRS